MTKENKKKKKNDFINKNAANNHNKYKQIVINPPAILH